MPKAVLDAEPIMVLDDPHKIRLQVWVDLWDDGIIPAAVNAPIAGQFASILTQLKNQSGPQSLFEGSGVWDYGEWDICAWDALIYLNILFNAVKGELSKVDVSGNFAEIKSRLTNVVRLSFEAGVWNSGAWDDCTWDIGLATIFDNLISQLRTNSPPPSFNELKVKLQHVGV